MDRCEKLVEIESEEIDLDSWYQDEGSPVG